MWDFSGSRVSLLTACRPSLLDMIEELNKVKELNVSPAQTWAMAQAWVQINILGAGETH